MKAPISLCIIVKNDPLLPNCIKSIRDFVEEIVIVDTGSTPENQAIYNNLADIFEVYTDCNNSELGLIENFSKARQRSYDLATKDWVMWADSDDEIVGGENLIGFTSTWHPDEQFDAVSILFPYEYCYNENGECTLKHYRERLVSNKKYFKWINPVHEVLVNKENIKVNLISDDSLIYKHKRQYSTKPTDPNRNLRILKKYVENEGKGDPRQLYYLGLEYCNNGFVNEAINLLIEYIVISGWDDERVMACLKLVEIYMTLANFQEGLKWAFKAIEINENWGEGYFALGKLFYNLAQTSGPQQYRNWQRCVNFIKQGLALPPTKTLLFINPLEREHEIYKYLNVAQNAIGDVKGALESTNIGLQKQNDDGLVFNKKLYQEFLSKQQITLEANILKQIGSINQESFDTIISTINKQPISITKELETKLIKNDGLDIIFALGDGIEIWNPNTVKQLGIGGSEIMAMEMAKRLSKLGNRVRIYNSCGQSGIYDGVEYYPTHMYNNLNCDVLVVSRNAIMLEDTFNIQAKLKLLWVHDVYAINATNARLLKADKILALSEWHKQNLIAAHNIHPEHIIVTRNAIDLSRFDKKIERNKYRAINSSSPDRSWITLLDCWPAIKAKVPKAELHLFYGFKNWEYSATEENGQKQLIIRLKQQIKELEPFGVIYHDRVNQEQLAEEFMKSGLWAHPTWFTETSCITAMEAQAAGLRMVTSSIAALNETVADRGILLAGDWMTDEYRNNFVNSVTDAMNRNDGSDRVALQKYAKEYFGFDTLAEDWEKMFNSLIKEMKVNPLVPYYATTKYR